MTRNQIADETLMAYADGELTEAEAVQVDAALAADPAMVRRLEVFTGTRDAMKNLAEQRQHEQVPEHVLAHAKAAIERAAMPSDNAVVPFKARSRPSIIWPTALAASLAIAAFLGGYTLAPGSDNGTPDELRVALLASPGLSDALTQVPAGERTGIDVGEVSVIASFRDGEGVFCREFEVDGNSMTTVVSVACWNGEGWEPRFAVVAAADDGTQYAPASSLGTLDAYLTAIDANAPMSLEDEASALRAISE